MEQDKLDSLLELKKLLDAGAFTQEEFDVAKIRILDSADVPPQQEQIEQPSCPIESSHPTSKKKSKLILLGGIGAIVVIVIMVLSISRSEDITYSSSYDSVEESTLNETEVDYAYDDDYSEEVGDGLTVGNPWRKDYFGNEWDEPIPSKPMLYSTIGESYWGIRIEYVPPTNEVPQEVFRFFITKDGKITEVYGPIEILVRGADGETKKVEVADEKDYPAYIIDPSTVDALKFYFNQEQFDIRINFDIYGEGHSQGQWRSAPGSLQEAIDKLL